MKRKDAQRLVGAAYTVSAGDDLRGLEDGVRVGLAKLFGDPINARYGALFKLKRVCTLDDRIKTWEERDRRFP